MENSNDEAIISYEMATEYGFIEKLCATFGFIKCLNKDNQEKRLFFHSSEVKCGFEEMKLGDYVTFKRGTGNGKPLAKEVVVKRKDGEREEGLIVKMAKKGECGNISYKYNEECYYVNFSREDVMEPGKLKVKDEVTFECVERDGTIMATNVCKKYNRPMKMQGVVTCIKDKYGFIDRCDIVKEIYFNVATSPEYAKMLPGTEVDFSVKHLRNGKEEAVNLKLLEKGSVKFVDIFETVLYGTLLRCPDTKRATSGDQLTGNISYACPSEATVLQIPFAEKDKLYPYSLHPGDIVAFKMAVDRRDELHHACEVHLCLDQFPSRKETRHYGVIKMYDHSAGLIETDLTGRSDQCDMLVAFKGSEWLQPEVRLAKFMAVSYTPVQIVRQLNGYAKTTWTAVRIMPLKKDEKLANLRIYPSGSLCGTVKTAVLNPDDLGIIVCNLPNAPEKRSIPFTCDDIDTVRPKVGDEVTFGCLDRTTNIKYLPPTAFDVKVKTNRDQTTTANNSSCTKNATPKVSSKISEGRKVRSRTLPDDKIKAPVIDSGPTPLVATDNLRGWVVIMKDHFGFVETADHRTLYKFNPGQIKKNTSSSEIVLGSAVEFTPCFSDGSRHKRIVDVFTKVLPAVDLCQDIVRLETGRVGTIVQSISITENTDRDNQYHGLISDCETERTYRYSMTSLANFKTKLFTKDRVMFNVSQTGSDAMTIRATDIILMRQCSRVLEVKDGVVFLERYSIDDDDCAEALPQLFQIDCDKVTVASGTLGPDDIVQLDLDLDYQTREVFVASHKLIKSMESIGVRKVFKVADDLQSRILHWRKPRLPVGDSIGFGEELREEPRLKA